MHKTKLGWLIALTGLVIIVVSLGADALGLGAMPGVIGWKQWLGTAVGAVVLILGVWLALRRVPLE